MDSLGKLYWATQQVLEPTELSTNGRKGQHRFCPHTVSAFERSHRQWKKGHQNRSYEWWADGKATCKWSICDDHNTCQDYDKIHIDWWWGALQAALRISPRWAYPDGRSGLPAALQAEVASSPPPPTSHAYMTFWVSSTGRRSLANGLNRM